MKSFLSFQLYFERWTKFAFYNMIIFPFPCQLCHFSELFRFSHLFFRKMENITLNGARNSLPVLTPLFFVLKFFLNFFSKVGGILLWTMNETRKYIIWSPFPCFSIFSFCPNFFVFLNFFRVLRKLYFERWMQIAIKCIKGPLHLSFSTFSFSQLFRFFLNFFSKVGGTSLWIIHVIGKYTIWAPFSFASQLLFFSTFSFLNFFRLFGKLVFERWTQFAIKYGVYNFTLIYHPLSIF